MQGHGGDIFEAGERAGIPPEEILDFSSNVNPLGPPACVREVLSASSGAVARYPDSECRRLRRSLGGVFRLDPDRIMIGNGSTELIYLLARALSPRRAALFPPCYRDYWRACEQAGAEVAGYVSVAEDDFALPAAMLAAAGEHADMVWLGNPNNPTGALTDRDDILKAAEGQRETLFVVDEAFIEFLDDYEARTLLAGEVPTNVIVLRSLTKFFAVPGLRLGFLAADPALVRKLAAVKEPWTVNGLALAVGERLYEDEEYIRRTRAAVGGEREFLARGLAAIGGLRPFPSRACFILVRIEADGVTASALRQRLLEQRILIRDASNFRGLDNRYVRFAVRQRADNERLLDALRQALAGSVSR